MAWNPGEGEDRADILVLRRHGCQKIGLILEIEAPVFDVGLSCWKAVDHCGRGAEKHWFQQATGSIDIYGIILQGCSICYS